MAQWVKNLRDRRPVAGALQRARHFGTDISGNVGMMLAVSSVALIGLVGAAIDYSQMTNDVQKAQDTVDAAVLAAAHDYYKDFARKDAQIAANTSARFHLQTEEHTGAHNLVTELTETEQNVITIKSSIDGTTRHKFMGIFGQKETKWTRVAYSTVSVPQVEIMLVIDASFSMKGAKIENLKSSLTKFVEDVAPYRNGESRISVTLLPYAENINFGQKASIWLDKNNPGGNFNGCFRYRKVDRPGNLSAPNRAGGFRGIPFCPPKGSEAVLFSTDARDLTDRIRNLQLGYGTDTTRALIWAQRFLDPSWRSAATPFSADPPMTVHPETEKVVIVLTDGSIAITDENDDGRLDARRWRRRNTNQANQEFSQYCKSLQRVPNMSIYTVAYSVRNASLENRLKSCVTGNGAHFDANVGNLDPIFERIIGDLTPIRISG